MWFFVQYLDFVGGVVECDVVFVGEGLFVVGLIQELGNVWYLGVVVMVYGCIFEWCCDYLQIWIVLLDGGWEVVCVVQNGLIKRVVFVVEFVFIVGECFFQEVVFNVFIRIVCYVYVEMVLRFDVFGLVFVVIWCVFYLVFDVIGRVIGFVIIDVDYVVMFENIFCEVFVGCDVLLFNSDGDCFEWLVGLQFVCFLMYDWDCVVVFIDFQQIVLGWEEVVLCYDGVIFYVVCCFFNVQQVYGFVGVVLRELESRFLLFVWEV